MRATYDADVNMGYVYFQDKIGAGEAKQTIHVDKGGVEICIDLDKDGHILGVEVFNAEKRFPKELMAQAKKEGE